MSLEFDAVLAARGVDLALSVASGETVAVLGPNGSGKSTLLGLIAGSLVADSGHATLDGRVLFADGIRPVPPHRRGATLLAQQALLFPHLSVRDNVAFGPRSARRGRGRSRAIADEWMARAGVLALAHRRPGELSGGQAQRVAIARALAAQPRLLLLDEPMAALDVAAAAEVRRVLAAELPGTSTVLVTHDAIDAYALADRVIILDGGRIVDEGTPAAVLDRPRTVFAARLGGLELLECVLAGGELVTVDGARVAVVPEQIPEDGRVLVAVPASRITASAEPPPTDPDVTVIYGAIDSLEPRGDVIRIGVGAIAADVPARIAGRLVLERGAPVALSFHRRDALGYPRGCSARELD